MAKPRDYKAEYARRIASGLQQGLTRTQARGHPRAREAFASGKQAGDAAEYDPRIERAIRNMFRGESLTRAARTAGVSPERLRRTASRSEFIVKRAGRWSILPDHVRRRMLMYSDGEPIGITVVGAEPASRIGRYHNAVKQFLDTNKLDNLEPFVGDAVTDVHGRRWVFETRRNVLYRLAVTRDDTFEQVYRIVI